jgi:hypothetical protein
VHGVAHGYGVELDRVKVAKAEAFCRGALEELSQRGAFTSSGTAAALSSTAAAAVEQPPAAKQLPGKESGSSRGADVAKAAVDQLQQQQEQQTPEESVGSQPSGSDVTTGHADVLSVDASSSQASDAVAAAASGTAAGAGAAAAACGGAAAAAGGGDSSKGSCKGSRGKGQLQQPQSSPIITCASIEQVS